MVTPMSFQDSLNDFLEKEVASKFLLKSIKIIDCEEVEYVKHPKVVRSGWVLPKSIDDDENNLENFPYIVTRIDKIENVSSKRESVVTMVIIFGVYDPGVYDKDGKLIDDGSGYRDFWNLVETTRQELFSQMILDKKYLIEENYFEAEMLYEQVYPYWEGYCKTKWHVTFPVPQIN